MDCKNILVIEDDRAVREMLKDVLELEGFTVATAGDGQEGFDRLREISPLPCMILLDLMMPGTNGWQFLDRQRSDPYFRKVPVIICSAYKESAKSVHAAAIVEKPVNLGALLDAVHAFCA